MGERIKKLKKIRIHREGTNELTLSALAIVCIAALIWYGLHSHILLWAFLIIFGTAWMIALNFYRCPIRYFNGDSEKLVVAPADGKIVVVEEAEENTYFHDKRLMISIDVLVRQIAGALARRIVTYAKAEEECYIDEHMGFIKLGSRVDVFLPLTAKPCVTMDQPTTGDQTVIAKLA